MIFYKQVNLDELRRMFNTNGLQSKSIGSCSAKCQAVNQVYFNIEESRLLEDNINNVITEDKRHKITSEDDKVLELCSLLIEKKFVQLARLS